MSERNYLPLLLVSTSDFENASKMISEMIDDEVPESAKRRRDGRLWRITNKYYCVDIEVCIVVDGEAMPPALHLLEAHIIHIAEVETATAERWAEMRWGAAGAERAQVCLVVGERAGAGPLRAWCRRRSYELVGLHEPADPGDPAEPVGAQRVRAALHAHAWRGLRRLDRCAERPRSPEEEEEGEAMVERAEAFAEALGALEGVREAQGALSDEERRRRAERVVSAFCRALGHDPPAL